MTEQEHDTLVRNLLALFGASRNDLIQTHISSVITAGEFVYKLKKPVDFGFLDYSTLPRRKHFCEEEVRINGRYAPRLYLGVVPVTGTVDAHLLLAKVFPARQGRIVQKTEIDRLFQLVNEFPCRN
ncbi:MAG: hypothetical protein P8Y65_09130, partial [Campylobacterales bacterium]